MSGTFKWQPAKGGTTVLTLQLGVRKQEVERVFGPLPVTLHVPDDIVRLHTLELLTGQGAGRFYVEVGEALRRHGSIILWLEP